MRELKVFWYDIVPDPDDYHSLSDFGSAIDEVQFLKDSEARNWLFNSMPDKGQPLVTLKEH